MLVRRLSLAAVACLLGTALGSACSSSPKHPGHLPGGGTGGTYTHKDSGRDQATGGQAGTDAGDAATDAEAGGGASGTGGAAGDGGVPAHCSNNKKDQGETDVDCGGPCAPCGTGLGCAAGSDCQSQVCDSVNKTCKAPSCSDTVRNGGETDVDCGGSACPPCVSGKSCLKPSDCSSGVCSGTPLTCQPHNCYDGVKNGNETDVDCGGPSCVKCGRGAVCTDHYDCLTDVCDASHHCACPNGMITVPRVGGVGGSFCIDKYEVSYADYAAFYNSNPVPKTAACAWKTNYTPSNNWPGNDVNLPVRNVDWCDAYGYCQAVSKRLCGMIGGGAGKYSSFTDANESQWFDACSAQGQNTYPYGSFNATTCNGAGSGDAGETLLDANRPGNVCLGGEPGLFDMSGNVAEWTDECQTAGSGSPQADTCRVRGGSYLDSNANLACAAPRTLQRDADADDVGFRCCLD